MVNVSEDPPNHIDRLRWIGNFPKARFDGLWYFFRGKSDVMDSTMSWLSRFRKEDPASKIIARKLHEILVEKYFYEDLLKRLDIPSAFAQKFLDKVARYREAIILMCLVSEAQDHKEFGKVLNAYKEMVFGPGAALEGIQNLTALDAAVVDLYRLFDPRGTVEEFAWGREWFAQIGYEADNPITNFLLARLWIGEYKATAIAIRRTGSP